MDENRDSSDTVEGSSTTEREQQGDLGLPEGSNTTELKQQDDVVLPEGSSTTAVEDAA